MNNFIKMAVAGAVAFVASKIVANDAKNRVDEVIRNKEALLNFATREQREDK